MYRHPMPIHEALPLLACVDMNRERAAMSTPKTAQIIEFPHREKPRPEVLVADCESWYHADEIRKDQAKRP